MKNFFIKIMTVILPLSGFFLASCNSGSGGGNYAVVKINTQNYGSKIATNVSIGDGRQILAEIDTGSEMTVVDESMVGPNIHRTNQSISITYGGGENTISGYLAYGSVKFTTDDGKTISTSSKTPILVVTNSAPNVNGNPNSAILGMRMDTQLSSRLFLPEPYNKMMILDKPGNKLVFGNLNDSQQLGFSFIQSQQAVCSNYAVPNVSDNICWENNPNTVTYSYDVDGKKEDVHYMTIFDSGEANASFYFSPAPPWMKYNNDGVIYNPPTLSINAINGNVIQLPLTEKSYFKNIPNRNTVNPGNNFFNYYQILFNQSNGLVGFKKYRDKDTF